MTLHKIGQLFNRRHSLVILDLKTHEKIMSEKYEYNGMEIKGNLRYLEVINKYQKELKDLLADKNE